VKTVGNVLLYGPASVKAYMLGSVLNGCIMLQNKIVGSPNRESGGAY
jgi:hypothetical protein